MFQLSDSMGQIMEDEFLKRYIKLLIPEEFIELVQGEDRKLPLEELKTKLYMPWGAPYISEMILQSANYLLEIKEGIYEFIPLWSEKTEGTFMPEADNSKNSVFLLKRKTDTQEQKPAVLICPGGGYTDVALASEGFPTFEKMEAMGYIPFILNYRTAPNRYPEQQKDMALAFKYLRANAQALGIDPENILLIGYSAGGHLSASETLYGEEYEKLLMEDLKMECPSLAERYEGISVKTDQLCLCYPVISFKSEYHAGSFSALTGGEEGLRDKLSVDLHLTQDFPKTFLWTCLDDSTVPPSNTIRMSKAMEEKNLDYKLKLYPTGEHGCCLGTGTSAEGWIDEMAEFMKEEES